MGAHESKPWTESASDRRIESTHGISARPLLPKHGRSAPREGWVSDGSSFQKPPSLRRLSFDDSSSLATHDEPSLYSEQEEDQIEMRDLSTKETLQVEAGTTHTNPTEASRRDCEAATAGRRRAFAEVRDSAACSDHQALTRKRTYDFIPSSPLGRRTTSAFGVTHGLLTRRERLIHEADRLEHSGNLLGARQRFEECTRLDQTALLSSIAVAYVLHRLGVLNWKIGAYQNSVKVLVKCLHLYDIYKEHSHLMQECIEGASMNEIIGLAAVLNSLGRVHVSTGEMDAACEYVCKGLDVLRHAISNDPGSLPMFQPCLSQSLVCLGMVNDARGRCRRAMEIFTECLRIQRACLGNDHVDAAATLNCIGGIHEKRCSYDKAMVCYSEALRIYRARLGVSCSPVDVAVTLNNVGFVHHLWSQYDRALEAFMEALEILRLWVGTSHRNFASTQYNIAKTFIERGSYLQGLELLKQVLRAQRLALGDDHPDVAVTLESIAVTYEYLGRLSKARRYHEKALAVRVHCLGSKHMLVARTLDQVGQLHNECGRLEQASQCFREALIVYRFNGLDDTDRRVRSMEQKLTGLDRRRGNNGKAKRKFMRHWHRGKQGRCEFHQTNYDSARNESVRYVL